MGWFMASRMCSLGRMGRKVVFSGPERWVLSIPTSRKRVEHILAPQSHTFKRPNEARPSLLGLDRLAAEKRAAFNASTPSSKRQRVDADDITDQDGNLNGGGVFKGKHTCLYPQAKRLTSRPHSTDTAHQKGQHPSQGRRNPIPCRRNQRHRSRKAPRATSSTKHAQQSPGTQRRGTTDRQQVPSERRA